MVLERRRARPAGRPRAHAPVSARAPGGGVMRPRPDGPGSRRGRDSATATGSRSGRSPAAIAPARPAHAGPPSPASGIREPTSADGARRGPTSRIEAVTLDSDADLQRFVARAAGAALRVPRERRAIRDRAAAFRLRRAAAAPGAGSHAGAARAMRVDKGAVTERIVREAAAAGARLVLARGAPC